MYQVTAVFDAIDNISRTAANIGGNVEGLGSRVQNAGRAMMSAGAKLTAGVTAPIVGIGVAAAKAAIDVESAFAGVIKTTDGLVDETGKLTQAGEVLKQGFRDLAKEVPMAVEELMAIGEIGGQLGIAQGQLLDFTRTIAALGVSTNLTTEEAAQALARISNIFAVSTDDMGENVARLGATIVALGNSFATSEAEITNFALRIAGAGQIAGLAQSDILAIGAAMSSVGVQAEAGGTAVQKVLIAMNTAVTSTGKAFVDNTAAIGQMEQKLMSLNANLVRYEAQTGVTAGQMRALYQEFRSAGGTLEEFGRQLGDSGRQKLFETVLAIDATREAMEALRAEQGKPIEAGNLQTFARVAGMTADEFKAAWEDDAAGAFQKFVEGLGKEGDNAVNVLSELGLEDQRLVRSFLSLANAGDLLGETIDMATTAWDENSALTKEAGQRYATVESQLVIVKNVFKDLLVTLGERFLPIIRDVIEGAKGVAAWISNLPEPVVNTALAIAALAAAAGPVVTILGVLTTALGALLSPVGLVVAAIAGLAAAFATNFLGIRDAVQPVIDWLKEAFDKIVAAVGPTLMVLKGAAGDIIAAFQEGGLPAAIEEFKALWPDISGAIQLGLRRAVDAVGPMLTELGQNLAKGASQLGGQLIGALSDALGVDLGSALSGVADALGPVVDAVSGAIGDIVGAFKSGGLAGAINEFKNLWPGLKDAIGEGLGKAADAVGPALSAIGGKLLAAGGELGTKLVEGLSGVLGVDLFAVFSEIGSTISTAFESISNTVSTVWEPIRAIFASIGEVLGPTVAGAFENLKAAFAGLAPLGESVKGLFEELWPVLQAVGAVIAGVVVGAIGLLVGAINGLVEGVSAAAPYIVGAVTAAVDIIAGAIGVVVDAVKLLVAWIEGDSEKIAEVWTSLKDHAEQIWTGIKDLIVNSVTGLVELVTGLIGGFIEGIIGFFTGLYERLVGGSIIPDMVNAIISWFQTLLEPVTAVWQGIQAVTDAAWGAIRAVVETAVKVVKGVVVAAMKLLQGDVSGAWKAIQAATDAAWGAIKGLIETAIGAVVGAMSKVADAVPAVKKAWDNIKSSAQDAWERIVGTIEDAIDDAKRSIEDGIDDWLGAWERFRGDVGALWDKIVLGITSTIGLLRDNVAAIWLQIESAISMAIARVRAVIVGLTAPLSTMKGLFENLRGVADGFRSVLDKLAGTFNRVKSAIENALAKLRDFLSALADAVIPDWLQGHSPSPLEIWVSGAASAFDGLAGAAARFAAEMSYMDVVAAKAETFNEFASALLNIIDVMSALRRYTGRALDLSGFLADLASLKQVMMNLGRGIYGTGFEDVVEGFEVIRSLLDAMNFIAEYEYVGIDRSKYDSLRDDLMYLMRSVAEAWIELRRQYIEQGQFAALTDNVNKLLSAISNMVGPLKAALSTLTLVADYTSVVQEKFDAFRKDIIRMIKMAYDISLLFAEETLDSAVILSTAVGVIAEMLGTAAIGFRELQGYAAVGAESMGAFFQDLKAAVEKVIVLANEMEDVFLDAAVAFARAAGSVVGVIGDAVGNLSQLADYGGAPAAALEQLWDDLGMVVQEMVRIAADFEQDAVEAAALFSESVGVIGQALADTVDGFAELAGYGGIAARSLDAFRADLPVVINLMIEISRKFKADAVEAAALFSESVGVIGQAIGDAVQGIADLAEYGGVTREMATLFRDDLVMVVQVIEGAIGQLAGVDLAAMGAMLDQIETIADAVDASLQALTGLAEYEGGIGAGLEAFISDLELLIEAFEELRDAIPEWLVPGSPTPFEKGVRGIAGALGQMQGALPDTSGLFALPAPEPLFGGLAVPPGGGGDGARTETHYHLDYHGYTRDDPGERDAARVLNELAILTGDRR